MYGYRGLGLEYDAAGMPIEDPANTTYGGQSSGGTCPGSPGCPGYAQLPAAQAQTLTQWFNANSTMVALGAAGFVALLLFAKAGR
jgi:hypothetical protein